MKLRIFYPILVLFSLLSFQVTQSQEIAERVRLKGRLIDTQSNKPLKNFPVKINEFNRSHKTDTNGEFLFNLASGTYTFVLDDFPFEKREITITLNRDTTILFEMETEAGLRYLEEVEIISSKPLTKNAAAISKLSSREMANIPTMVGERDLLRWLSLTAGVSSSSEGAADIQVRGGTHGQNLFLLDNIPLYSTQHMLGMVSVFNPTIIRSADLYKAGFPAYYGGRIASVLDVQSKNANLNKRWTEIEISLLSSKAALNIPIVANKLALNIAGRISNYSLINLISFSGIMSDTKLMLHFADLNAHLLYQASKKDQIKLSFMHNSDGIRVNQLDYDELNKLHIKNRQGNIGINWERIFSDKSRNNLHFYADGYWFSFLSEQEKGNPKRIQHSNRIGSNIRSLGLTNKLSHQFTEKLKTESGISLHTYVFSPFVMENMDTSIVSKDNKSKRFDTNMFIHSVYSFLPNQSLDAGMRLSIFGNNEKLYPSFEPRIAYHSIFNNQRSLSASVSYMTQNIHRIANPGLGFTMELFHPSGIFLKPSKAWIYSLGGAKDFRWNDVNFSIKSDLWYKKLYNLVEFQDGYDIYSVMVKNQELSNQTSDFLTQGNGKAYGIDFSGNITLKQLRFTVDYTLMQARNHFEMLNNGHSFAASTDIRNALSLSNELKLNKKWTFSASWQYRTGQPITLPTAIFPIPDMDLDKAEVEFNPLDFHFDFQSPFHTIETERNNARMRAYHKLDIAFNRKLINRKKVETNLSFGIYNLYNRANPSYYYISAKKIDGINYPALKSISMFPILPSFSWSIKF